MSHNRLFEWRQHVTIATTSDRLQIDAIILRWNEIRKEQAKETKEIVFCYCVTSAIDIFISNQHTCSKMKNKSWTKQIEWKEKRRSEKIMKFPATQLNWIPSIRRNRESWSTENLRLRRINLDSTKEKRRKNAVEPTEPKLSEAQRSSFVYIVINVCRICAKRSKQIFVFLSKSRELITNGCFTAFTRSEINRTKVEKKVI